ncbi:hypothetical protein BJ971_002685 [Actinoplanes digitatis]|uniref:Uncharacterized protein n=1 Tax=Actinoplanes digitatis TaxID=1868 RepID=A0A7W7HWM8_9ACTN|nr:hypothetical protein [Actinoplanes digitatis]
MPRKLPFSPWHLLLMPLALSSSCRWCRWS